MSTGLRSMTIPYHNICNMIDAPSAIRISHMIRCGVWKQFFWLRLSQGI